MIFAEKISPNFNRKKRPRNMIKFLIIHYTGMQSERESINRLCDPNSKVSCHYLINSSGKIYRLVSEKNTSWHAGKSKWQKYRNLNSYSLGIELVNKGHRWGYKNFKAKQIKNLIKLCKYLKKKYNLKKQNILGHSDIAPLRKKDPGEKFPWQFLSKKGIGIWHNIDQTKLKKLRREKITVSERSKGIKLLKNIGYFNNKLNDKKHSKLIKSFQRRFRQELVDGIMDLECLIIAEKLRKLYK